MKHLISFSCRVAASLCTLAACCVFSGNVLAAPSTAAQAQGNQIWLAASDRTLDKMRGGFDIGATGLMVSFGVVRSIAINGNLIVTTSFNIANLGLITPQQAALVSQQVGGLNLIQNGPGNTVQQPTPYTAAPASSVTLGTATLSTAPISGASLGTFIQNTLSNQNIQSQTVINASTNSLGMAKGLNMLNSLNSVLTNALGTR